MIVSIIIICMQPEKIRPKKEQIAKQEEVIIPKKEEIAATEETQITEEKVADDNEIKWKIITVKSGQSLYTLFKDQNISIKEMVNILNTKNDLTKKLSSLNSGDKISFGFIKHNFNSIKMDVDAETNMTAQKDEDNNYKFTTEKYPVDIAIRNF